MNTAHDESRPMAPPGIGRGYARGRVRAALLLGLLFFAAATQAWAEPITKEYQLKAAFLYNFTKFVEWPADRFDSDTSPIVIAVLGHNPFHDELEKLVAGRQVNGRSIRVRFIASAAEVDDVHIVFVSASNDNLLGGALLGVPGVLTVGESADFGTRGGVIRFTLVDEKVRFEINQTSGEKAGLKISGQLLKLATRLR